MVVGRRLERYDHLRVTDLFLQYGTQIHRVYISLPSVPALFGAFVDVRAEIVPTPPAAQPSATPGPVEVLSISIEELARDNVPCQRGVSVIGLKATQGSRGISATTAMSDMSTKVLCPPEVLDCADCLVVEFSTPCIYSSLPEREPFARSLLSFNLDLWPKLRTVLFVGYPAGVSLRGRIDDALYQSLALATSDGTVQKISFFEQPPLDVKWFFGTNVTQRLFSPIAPLFEVSVSLLAEGFTLALVKAGLNELASAVFALGLLPPFIKIFSRREFFAFSSDIRRLSWADISILVSYLIYVPLTVLTCDFLLSGWSAALEMRKIDFGCALASLLACLLYYVAVQCGVLQRYVCDRCGRGILWRLQAKLDVQSRRTMCASCWHELQIARSLEPPEH